MKLGAGEYEAPEVRIVQRARTSVFPHTWVIQITGWETDSSGWKEEDGGREWKAIWPLSKSTLDLSRVWKWLFVSVLHKLACCRSEGDARRVGGTATRQECQSTVCPSRRVRVFITSGFIQAQSSRERWPVLAGRAAFVRSPRRKSTKRTNPLNWFYLGLSQLISSNE